MAMARSGGVEFDANGNMRAKNNASWVTEDQTVPDPVVEVRNEFVCIRPIEISSKIKTNSGFELIAPENQVEKQNIALTVGRVVGVGEFAGKRQNVSKPNVGDYVIFPKYGGRAVLLKGVRVVFLHDDEIMATVNKEDISLDVTV